MWNCYVHDCAVVVQQLGFQVVIYAHDLNVFRGYDRSISTALVLEDLHGCQHEVHRWGAANRVVFDSAKESFAILSTTCPEGNSFTVLGVRFDTKLLMHECARTTAEEAGWRLRTLFRTMRFYTDIELINLFKAHVLSIVDYRTPALYHAATSTLRSADFILTNFLKLVLVSDVQALVQFRLAPLSARRDMAMLGVIHRAVLGGGPRHVQEFSRVDTQCTRRSVRQRRHDKQLCADNFTSHPLESHRRSVFGLIRVYNLLPANVVGASSVSAFQQRLQKLMTCQATSGARDWQVLFSPRLQIVGHRLCRV